MNYIFIILILLVGFIIGQFIYIINNIFKDDVKTGTEKTGTVKTGTVKTGTVKTGTEKTGNVKTRGIKTSTGNRRTTYDGITDGLLNNLEIHENNRRPGYNTISRSLSPHNIVNGNDIKFKFIFNKIENVIFESPEYIVDIDSDSNNSIETALVKTLQKPYLIDNTDIKLKYNYINNVNKKNIQLKIYKNNMNSKIGNTHVLTRYTETITIVPQHDNNNIDTIYLKFERII